MVEAARPVSDWKKVQPAIAAHLIEQFGPCVGLYHLELQERPLQKTMPYSVSRKELSAQAVLVVRRRVARTEVAATIGAELPKVFMYAQKHGMAISGFPITRYLESSVAMVTLETGMRVTGHSGDWDSRKGDGVILAETLPAGPAAVMVHAGPYDQLQAAYAAVEEWIAAHKMQSAGSPWESYLNDPAAHPNPQDWQTEVCWPIRPA